MGKKIVAVDFDGTCVEHRYPDVGRDVPYCFEVLKRLEANGVKIILWTMRSGKTLQDAVDWFAQKNIPLWGVNENPEQIETKWSTSPKAYAPIYIDDAALGCPTVTPMPTPGEFEREYVDWRAVEKLLQSKNYL
ncbi:MAG TPA: hypothetical protein VIL74_09000 [Pyrinomonadaceae bacterium]|jgi:hypothetical protein